MIHLFKSAAARTVTVVLLGVLAIGILIGAVRLALPFADLFRSQVEGLLADTLGLEARVGRFGLRLAGWIPRLTLTDVVLLDPGSGRRQLSLEELRLDLDLASSARELSPQVASLTLVGAHLVVKRRANGSITVAGLEGMETGNPQAMDFFLANGRFLLVDSSVLWVDDRAGAPPVHLSDVRGRFDNAGARHRVGLVARLFSETDTEVRLAGDLRGAPEQPDAWSGDVYVRVRGRSLEPLLGGRLPRGLHVGSDAVELESWSRLSGSALADSVNRIEAENLVAWRHAADGTDAPLHLDQVQAIVRWQKDGAGWRIEVADLGYSRGRQQRPPADLALRFAPEDGGGWSLSGGVQSIHGADLRDALGLVPNIEEWTRHMRESRVQGELKDLRFSLRQRPDEAPLWGLSGRALAVAAEPAGGLPGIRGLDASFAVDQTGGDLTLDGQAVTLMYPAYFGTPVALDRLRGDLRWYPDAGAGWRIAASELSLENQDIRTRSHLALMVPVDGSSPRLDLRTEILDADLAAVRRYIPTGRLKKRLATWLERAFVSGTVPSGTLRFSGALGDFPFEGQEGLFRVLLEVEDTILDYHPDWPRLEALSGEVEFENLSMEVTIYSGRLLDSDILEVTAHIPDLAHADWVRISGATEGPFRDGLRLLDETPLQARLGALTRALQVEGCLRVDITDLTVPLPKPGETASPALRGEISWPGQAAVSLAGADLRLDHLAGRLAFREDSLTADAIDAELWGIPVRMRIATEPGVDGSGGAARIDATSKMPTQVLAQRLPSSLWEYARGESELKLRLDIEHTAIGQDGIPLAFSLESDLSGIAVDLPPPLGKEAASRRTARLEGTLAPGEDLELRGGYGDLGLHLGFQRDASGGLRFTRGNLNLSGKAAPVGEPGMSLSGRLASLDLGAWLNWWERQDQAGARAETGVALRSADIQVGRLELGKLESNDLRLTAERNQERWQLRIQARELAGDVRIPHRPRGEPLRVHLQRLDLAGLMGEDGGQGRPLASGKKRPDPRRAHLLELRIDSLLWADNLIGEVSLDSSPTPNGIEYTPLRLTGGLMNIDGEAWWTSEAGAQHTAIELDGKGEDLGEFLRHLGYESLIYKAPATASFRLQWAGGPSDLAAEGLNGEATIEVGKGSLLDLEPGVGRMLGIMNLGALQRRLSLDFSDLFGRGYAFERITGELSIRDGQATIEKLLIDGPSASVEVTGSTDLVRKEFDQVVTVTPRIGTGVALAGAVAGGPLVGAAVYLVDRVSGGAVDKLVSYQYDITGPWDSPAIVRRGSQTEGDSSQAFVPGHSGTGAQRAETEEPEAARVTEPIEEEPKKPGPNLFLPGH